MERGLFRGKREGDSAFEPLPVLHTHPLKRIPRPKRATPNTHKTKGTIKNNQTASSSATRAAPAAAALLVVAAGLLF